MAYVDISGREQAAKQDAIKSGLAQLFEGAGELKSDEAKRQALELERKKAKLGFAEKAMAEGITTPGYANQEFEKIYGPEPVPEKSFFSKLASGVGSLFQPSAETAPLETPQVPKEEIKLPEGFKTKTQLTRQKLEREAQEAALPYEQTREYKEYGAKEEMKLKSAEKREEIKAAEKLKSENNKSLKDLDLADSLIKNIESNAEEFEKTGKSLGPLRGGTEWLKSFVGQGDPEFIKLKAKMASNISEVIKKLSGTAASEGEVARIKAFQPSASDTLESLKAKTQGLREFSKVKKDTLSPSGGGIKPLGQQNKNISPKANAALNILMGQ